MRRAVRGWSLVATFLILVPSTATLPGILATPVVDPLTPPQGLVLSAIPTYGSAPLLVQFSVTFPNGTPPGVSWDFGDGSPVLNGSGSAESRPAHLYADPGTYRCRVVAVWPAGSENASTPIEVVAGELNSSATASTLNGTAPLTVWFNATVRGGTGTYIAYQWGFGDGDTGSGLSLRYTYDTPGRYLVNFTVVDSANRSVVRSFVIDVHASTLPNASEGNGEQGSGGVYSLTTPLVIGLAASGVAALAASLVWIRRSRTHTIGPVPRAPESLVILPETPMGPSTPGMDPALGDSEDREHPIDAALVSETTPGPLGERAGGSRDIPPGLVTPQRLTYQLIRHLSSLPRLWPGDLPTREWTQAGMAAALGVGQSAVSRILRRLTAANVVRMETSHVRESNRRMRVYRLTERGERLGRAIREPPPTPPRTD
jgi:DNA-binding transcriptional ArsR family regulator